MANKTTEDLYLEWVKQACLPPLTNNQKKMADFLLSNEPVMSQVGNMEDIFKSIQKFLKYDKRS